MNPLGLTLLQRGDTKDSKEGVVVSAVNNPELPQAIKGMVVDEVNGEVDVTNVTGAVNLTLTLTLTLT